MQADDLAPSIWNSIAGEIERARGGREIVFGKVVKRDTTRKLIWLEAYGDLAIPLVSFTYSFEYYDTDQDGVVTKRADPTGMTESLQTKMVVPRVGQTAVVLDPGGMKRFPLCVGVIQSPVFWEGASSGN